MAYFQQIFSDKPVIFKDRHDAGRQLSKRLKKFDKNNPLVLALPRGGVVVGYEVSKALDIPMDVIIGCKVGAPHNPEFGIGAISEGNIYVFDEPTIQLLGASQEEIERIISEMQRRIGVYRNNRQLPSLHGRTVILVDDGLATGVTAQAAIKSILTLNPYKLVFAVPVCAYETAETIKKQVDEFICLHCLHAFQAIGLYYQNFSQTTDEEVIRLLREIKKKYPTELISIRV